MLPMVMRTNELLCWRKATIKNAAGLTGQAYRQLCLTSVVPNLHLLLQALCRPSFGMLPLSSWSVLPAFLVGSSGRRQRVAKRSHRQVERMPSRSVSGDNSSATFAPSSTSPLECPSLFSTTVAKRPKALACSSSSLLVSVT